jgi:hypothetical protein
MCNVNGCLHIVRKPRRHDQWDMPVPEYDPYGPAQAIEETGDGLDVV